MPLAWDGQIAGLVPCHLMLNGESRRVDNLVEYQLKDICVKFKIAPGKQNDAYSHMREA